MREVGGHVAILASVEVQHLRDSYFASLVCLQTVDIAEIRKLELGMQ